MHVIINNIKMIFEAFRFPIFEEREFHQTLRFFFKTYWNDGSHGLPQDPSLLQKGNIERFHFITIILTPIFNFDVVCCIHEISFD